jgi:ATP-binding cassette subfamily B (MDR/TAP) protein 1
LAGDAIMNYRTVASFANEEKLVNDYIRLLEGQKEQSIREAHWIGITYGLSQFSIYGMMAALFYTGAQFLKEYKENPVDMFITIFAMNFGALASGQANQFGPDIAKAKAAALKIFSIIEQPTQITALNSDG